MSKFHVRRAAVLGAGVMGAQIAAHLANAGVPVLLFDLPAKEGDPGGIARKALDGLKKLKPAPFGDAERVLLVDPADYERHLAGLAGCDLVIEAIAERFDWKAELYRKVVPHLEPGTILATNTSGLSIARLAGAVPDAHRRAFCGIHFFNPPRYMALVELIAQPACDPGLLDALETWLTTRLGKKVIRAHDTPNFIANRIGVAWLLMVAHHTQRLGLAFDEVDLLTGTKIGLPKSATYRLLDVVGLDTMAHVIGTMRDGLPEDPWRGYFAVPGWAEQLIAAGATGQKAGRGIYLREGKVTRVLDPGLADYREAKAELAPEVEQFLAIEDAGGCLRALRDSSHPQAQLLWSSFRDLFHYCAVHLSEIADSARDVDLAMRWGYGWQRGPFERWQAAGWQAVAAMVAEDIAAGRAMAAVPLPGWVGRIDGVHGEGGSWSVREGRRIGRRALPVYRRQLIAERLHGEPPDSAVVTRQHWANGSVRLWTRDDVDPGIAILSITTRVHALGREVILGIIEAVALAEREFDGLVFWQEAPFGVGANLKEVLAALGGQRFDELETMIANFQRASLALRYAQVPTVAAVEGMALGGACEFAMYAGARVVAFESYLGLVEAGVGLIPAGGGCAHFARRASELSRQVAFGEPFPFLQNVFTNVAQGKVSGSALEAKAMGFLEPADTIVFHPGELLYVAIRQARQMAEAGWVPPTPAKAIVAAGRTGIANCELALVNMREGGFISEHDYRVARAAAVALCGGEVEAGTPVSEDWILAVERRLFIELLRRPETQARIAHMMETGRPLRN
ncbi:MAG: 3-hydroxyacyl-CoA dehydrogenase/enoyl-CoA hydratase family protein [Hyphomicrobiales bacterium]|nr:3-hydroxyacyl-CoA dehydrogenase/enoyl-CoA hydratase family protein [Hyphomicrobiales bacterium]